MTGLFRLGDALVVPPLALVTRAVRPRVNAGAVSVAGGPRVSPSTVYLAGLPLAFVAVAVVPGHGPPTALLAVADFTFIPGIVVGDDLSAFAGRRCAAAQQRRVDERDLATVRHDAQPVAAVARHPDLLADFHQAHLVVLRSHAAAQVGTLDGPHRPVDRPDASAALSLDRRRTAKQHTCECDAWKPKGKSFHDPPPFLGLPAARGRLAAPCSILPA